MEEKPNYLAVIKSPGFKYLWANQVLVQLSYNALNFALIIWVYKLTSTNLAISALLLAIYSPALIFGLLTGVLIDLVDRRKVIILVDILLAVSFLFFIFIKYSYPLILLNAFLINTLAQVFIPTESSSIPLLVPKKYLFLANSLFSLTLYGSLLIGYTIAGPLLNNLGMNAIFIFGTILLFIAFLTSQRLPEIKVDVSQSKLNVFSSAKIDKILLIVISEVKKTLNFISKKMEVMAAIGLLVAVQVIIGGLVVITPDYLERVLKIHATDASYFLTLPLGLGMVFGTIILGRFFSHFPRRSLVVPGIIGGGILLLLVGATPFIAHLVQSTDLPSQLVRPRYFFHAPSLSFYFALGAFVSGICAVAIIVPSQTVLQLNTEEENRGKIFAVLAALMTAFSILPVVLTGWLSDLFGATPIFIILGATIFLVGILVLRPNLFFQKNQLSYKIRAFLGLGHWEEQTR